MIARLPTLPCLGAEPLTCPLANGVSEWEFPRPGGAMATANQARDKAGFDPALGNELHAEVPLDWNRSLGT